MNFNSLRIIILSYGLVADIFALVFLLQAFGISVSLISLEAQHPNLFQQHILVLHVYLQLLQLEPWLFTKYSFSHRIYIKLISKHTKR